MTQHQGELKSLTYNPGKIILYFEVIPRDICDCIRVYAYFCEKYCHWREDVNRCCSTACYDKGSLDMTMMSMRLFLPTIRSYEYEYDFMEFEYALIKPEWAYFNYGASVSLRSPHMTPYMETLWNNNISLPIQLSIDGQLADTNINKRIWGFMMTKGWPK